MQPWPKGVTVDFDVMMKIMFVTKVEDTIRIRNEVD